LAGERGLQNPTGPDLEDVAAANGFDVAEAIDSARMWVGEPPENEPTQPPISMPRQSAAQAHRDHELALDIDL
jgi:hypothetical protein